MRKQKNPNQRLWVLQAVFVILSLLLLHRLWKLQIVGGQAYADHYELKISRTVTEKNVRGMIYDRNGEVLAYNKLVYTVTMTDDGVYATQRERQLALNGLIYRVLRVFEENGEQAEHGLKIRTDADGKYQYIVSKTALARFRADVFGKAGPDTLTAKQKKMSAEEVIQYLASNDRFAFYGQGKREYTDEERLAYGLPKEYTSKELLAMAGIRYQLSLNAYQKYVPVVLARDISQETAAYIMEDQKSLMGIAVGKEWKRVYNGGEAFSHILGYTGKISPKELTTYADSGHCYTMDSIVGKAGIEQSMEEVLQGTDGQRRITVNNVGKKIGEDSIIRKTVRGRDVYLSIDKELQLAVYQALEKNLAGIVAENLVPAKEFDFAQISDASGIRIPIYDVYLALVENQVICIEGLFAADASELERSFANLLKAKQKEAKRKIREAWNSGADYADLPEEIQEYSSYLIEETGILNEEAIDPEDEVYQKWNEGRGISVKEFLSYAAVNQWVVLEPDNSGNEYATADEMYALLTDAVLEKLADPGFWRLLFQRLLLEEKITGNRLCMLLYDQQVLKDTDGSYEKLAAGTVDAFSFLKQKIKNAEITPAQLALDPCSASAVVVQPHTGSVLALVSYPGYDHNRLANQMDASYYSQLLSDRSLPLYNRATQQLTAPGSTLKPVTVIAGLQEGLITADSEVFCDGVFDKVEPPLRCWKHSGHGAVKDAPMALQFSCNDYMCEIAYRMGTKNRTEYTDNAALECLQKYAKQFYLDQKSGVELAESNPHVTDAYGIPSAIGQGTHNYATVQLARYVSIIASKGNASALSLIHKITDADGIAAKQQPVQEAKVELPASVWDTVRSGMVQFAKNNTVLKDMQIETAGKTGTAQEAKNRPDHALFVGYAPAKQPEIAVAVRIANGYGSSNSTAVGRDIFQYYFEKGGQEESVFRQELE